MSPPETIPRPLIAHLAGLAVPPPRGLDPTFFDPPTTALCATAINFVASHVPQWAVNHSLRTYAFALAIAQYAQWDSDDRGKRLGFDREEIFLACVLHEIGFEQRQAPHSRLSVELWGALKARDWILAQTELAPRSILDDYGDQAFESIALHTLEMQLASGSVRLTSALCALGANQDLLGIVTFALHPDTIATVLGRWPRLGYVDGLKEVALHEVARKPGCLFETCLDAFLEPMYRVPCFLGQQGLLLHDPEWAERNSTLPLL